MKLLSLAVLLPVLLTAQAASAEETLTELQRRVQEQERQIRQLELENGRLRSLVDGKAPAPLASLPAPSGSTISPSQQDVYVVREGDTLSRIARRYGTTPDKLVALNKLKNAELIRPGQKLKTPPQETPAATEKKPAPSAPAAAFDHFHTVRTGETFFSIARTYGLNTDALAAANPDVNPRSLQVGQKLRLAPPTSSISSGGSDKAHSPKPAAADKPAGMVSSQPAVRSVSIEEEITFGDFSARHRMTPAKLNALNGLNLDAKTVLAKGSELYVSAQP